MQSNLLYRGLTKKIIHCFYDVYNEPGSGFLESVYENALKIVLISEEMEIPERKVVVGNPAGVVKDVTDRMLARKTDGTKIYRALPHQLHNTLKLCEPLREITGAHKLPTHFYETWGEQKEDEKKE